MRADLEPPTDSEAAIGCLMAIVALAAIIAGTWWAVLKVLL